MLLRFYDLRNHYSCPAQHAKSPNYAFERFASDPKYLSDVVSFDLPLLGSLTDLKIVHLQCHIGTDTLSLARLGAKSVTGLDFSPASLTSARHLASQASSGPSSLTFIEASTYDAPNVLEPASFDLVYTGIGAICWLPSISLWAQTLSALLKPGGRLFMREGHPVVWALDDDKTQTSVVMKYPYFETKEATVYQSKGTYVATEKKVFGTGEAATWNHGLGEIVQALLDVGMMITGLIEHRSIPWRPLPGQMEQTGPFGKFSS